MTHYSSSLPAPMPAHTPFMSAFGFVAILIVASVSSMLFAAPSYSFEQKLDAANQDFRNFDQAQYQAHQDSAEALFIH